MMLDSTLATHFERARGAKPGESACPAPTINLHFSQLGVVTACCFNRSFVLGVYPESSVAQIWQGAAARQLREALARGDFSKGCDTCWQQIRAGDWGGSHAVFYTRQARALDEQRRQLELLPHAAEPSSALPLKLEFNLHNACNLQCIMCHGLASSAIRVKREGLHSLPNPYDDAFAQQLEAYLPYVVETDFMGGEPFLIPVYRKIWELLGRVNPKAKACILTNATILDAGLKRVLEGINCWIHVSIDSFRKDTYERIRRGASHDVVMANCRYFRDLMRERGMPLVWRYCPLRLNWHEIPETVSYCTAEGISLFFNQVDSPIGLSLTTLPSRELARIVDALEVRQPQLPATPLGLDNLRAYRELIERLRGFLRPEIRVSALRSRLETARAVVSQYSQGREQEIRTRPGKEPCSDELIRAVKSLLITRLNIEQASTTDGGSHGEFRARLETAQSALLALRGGVSFPEFLTTYLKELVRTYSGVWGVAEPHKPEVFGQIDELARAWKQDATDWAQLLRPSPGAMYEVIARGAPVEETLRWFDELAAQEEGASDLD